jgi:uncharacterized OsmC-like protein
MVQIDVQYLGDLRCESLHGPSKNKLLTDAPVDNHGRGESFSPTDLVGTALATCILTTMAIYAQKNGIDLRGAKATVQKEMTSVPTRRIARLPSQVEIPLPPTHPHREELERVALTCPVKQSIHPDLDAPIQFTWSGQ